MADEKKLAWEAARIAAARWSIDPESVELVSVSENIVFSGTSSERGKVAIRVHRPGYCSVEELKSEHAWGTALESTEVAIPSPVLSTAGNAHEVVPLNNGSTRQVGVIAWVPGQSMASLVESSGGPLEALDMFITLGAITAQLHNHTESWVRPDWFTRRSWDVDGFLGENPFWTKFWDVPSLSVEEAELFSLARAGLISRLTEFGYGSDRYGLIHADLHPNNILVSQAGSTVIDFDDAGFGWHLYDLAAIAYYHADSPDFAPVRDSLVSGYRSHRHLSETHLAYLDDFVLLRALAFVGWMNDRQADNTHGHLEQMIDLATNLARRFVETSQAV